MTEPSVALLGRLEQAAEDACRRAYEGRADIDGAINWADLHCVEAGYYRTSQGTSGVYVLIEEAAPIQKELSSFIGNDLFAAGWEGVEVRFEW